VLPTDAAIAANRFGLGARPGELQELGSAARDTLLEQLRVPLVPLSTSLPASHELLARVIAQREDISADKKDRAADVGKAEQGPSIVSRAKALRDIYRPAYVADVSARFSAAVTSERSFQERLVHFWSNHFAVSVDKLAVLGLAGAMEREAIRPHLLGKFADMLLAVEQHPAMLLYLDNQLSAGPQSQAAHFAGRRGKALGMNENLGREILELHTLGVDGRYTQQDVQALAALITGWSIGGDAGRLRGGEPGKFFFRSAFHQPGAATLLGKRYAEDGVAQGVAALSDLATNEYTARHLATKLARHFIADDPPAAAVERLRSTWLATRGDLPSVYRALIQSPESWQPTPAKFKTPSDYIYSAHRALSLPVSGGAQDLRVFELLGQRVFQPGSPAGWADSSADWDGSAALLKRLEWVQGVAHRLGASRDASQVADGALGATLSGETRRAIARAQDGAQALTLLLAAPEFMRR
jgi:uncharacterized protein (DUF1800 family)